MHEPAPERLRLLVVEDDYLPALHLAEMLEELGADVLGPVASVDDALQLLDRAPEIDAAILDVHLGGETVFPLADALLARGLPFAFATGYAPEYLPPRFEGVEVCRKPIEPAAVGRAFAHLRRA